jgi:hypothetical protein
VNTEVAKAINLSVKRLQRAGFSSSSLPLSVFACERYDAKALFKKWDRVFIAHNSFIAYGSTEEKAASRAMGRGSTADLHTVMPIAGCVCTAAAHDGKPHAMLVTFPSSPEVPEQCFAFATSDARDLFMREVQAKSISHAVPSTSASSHVAAEAGHPTEGNALAQVTLPNPSTAHLALDTAARNISISARATHIFFSPLRYQHPPALRLHLPLSHVRVKRSRRIQMSTTPSARMRDLKQRTLKS